MSPETLQALTRLIQALDGLAETLGSGWFAAIVIGVTALIVGVPAYREHRRNKRVEEIVGHKEREIERLAADNRRYREVYLSKLGVPNELLQMDRADSDEAVHERKQAKNE